MKSIKCFSISFFLFVGFNSAYASENQVSLSLQSLADSMRWDSLDKCSATYEVVLQKTSDAQKAVAEDLKKSIVSSAYNQFLQGQVKNKLDSLSAEVKYLQSRCQAGDYDGSSLSLERPARLEQMLQEWQSTIIWAKDVIVSEKYPNLTYVNKSPSLIENKELKPLDRFVDCTDSYCSEMVVIPAGDFVMGATEEEAVAEKVNAKVHAWEIPRHKVVIKKPFALSSTEVTLGSFQTFVNETGYSLPEGCTSLSPPANPQVALAKLFFSKEANYKNTGFKQGESEPVVCVRREDGRAYAEWLSKKTGHKYRLPTEAEWEYAARAGTQTTFFWGNNRDEACGYANVYDLTTDEYYKYGFSKFMCSDKQISTAPVASFKPNNFGIYDILANAREWVDDCWHYSYSNAPTDGSVWGKENNGLCQFGVLRGGAWAYNTVNVRIAYRNAYFSSQARAFMWGFRLARDI
ncbi:formylglycine-generating enzyme family protein [Pseudomonas sp. ICMP 8385]|uniref:formylglycine-generating enzyme family protein n=1 Tax=Pseudomonas sp. ICMP 8385 TaxID=1718920 RepID=UPI00211D2E73|nr:formylglycine-generating enzyme family protein [Pseudomonas sp. ICMP 8385]